ncbi:MAG: dynamin family protein [Chloroflexales bacterium]|nr:dynamin family protein [Chloroflexales bacterium]
MLTERQAVLLDSLRALLTQLDAALVSFGADVAPGDARALRDTLAHLDELFLLVVAGEFNSGKSSFINALLGATVMPEGVTPTTDRITLLRYGDQPAEVLREAALLERDYPADILRQLTIVDTPGTNAVVRRHEELTRDFIPRADLVLFTTSADRPFTESERTFLELIKTWGKKIVLVLNKIDILQPKELDQVLEFVRSNAYDLLGTHPEIFPVSARLAQQARSSDNPQALEQSRFAAVERYIVETLDEEERVRLKLLSPLGVAQHISGKYLTVARERLATLQDDFAALDNIERQLALFRQDLGGDLQYHINEVTQILGDMELRGMEFFDEHIRIGRIVDLVRGDRMRDSFEREVVADVPQQIEARVQALIDWMVEKNLRVWQGVMDYIGQRRNAQQRGGMIGEVGGAFDYNRQALLDSVGRTAREIVLTYDREVESQNLVDDVRASIAATAIVEAGAVGLGAIVIAVAQAAWLDVTGVLMATLVAVGGFYLIPAKRRDAKKNFRERVTELKGQLSESLRRQFESEQEQSMARIREAIGPYPRFVRAQREQLTEVQGLFADLDASLARFRGEIDQ